MTDTSLPETGVVLIVEDPFIRKFVRSVLARTGYRMLDAEEHHAVELIRDGKVKPTLLITNVPDRFVALDLQCPVIYTAAYPDPEKAVNFRACHLLKKPFHPKQLLDILSTLPAPA